MLKNFLRSILFLLLSSASVNAGWRSPANIANVVSTTPLTGLTIGNGSLSSYCMYFDNSYSGATNDGNICITSSSLEVYGPVNTFLGKNLTNRTAVRVTDSGSGAGNIQLANGNFAWIFDPNTAQFTVNPGTSTNSLYENFGSRNAGYLLGTRRYFSYLNSSEWRETIYGSGAGHIYERSHYFQFTPAGGSQQIILTMRGRTAGETKGDVEISGGLYVGMVTPPIAPAVPPASLNVMNDDASVTDGAGSVFLESFPNARDDSSGTSLVSFLYTTATGLLRSSPMGKVQFVIGDGVVSSSQINWDVNVAGTNDAQLSYRSASSDFAFTETGATGEISFNPSGTALTVAGATAANFGTSTASGSGMGEWTNTNSASGAAFYDRAAPSAAGGLAGGSRYWQGTYETGAPQAHLLYLRVRDNVQTMGDVVVPGALYVGNLTIDTPPAVPLASFVVKDNDAAPADGAGSVLFESFPDSRDDSLTAPVGFLYTDSSGYMRHAPLAAAASTGVPDAVTLGAAATELDPPDRARHVEVTSDAGGNTIATIDGTGYSEGDFLEISIASLPGTLDFTDTASPGADEIALAGGASMTADSILVLQRTATYWREYSRSLN